ncbi:MarR family winged helix-turn-helix transcriptional regulator [Aquicoccus sp. G2-2]|uniref:MarR family winged helix-turn-helix transcriptional regulator n=1 Tax=Aquicoccus sp. G2-2 TaxID=3092120 RepID=UPI002ADF99DF|nr:MarR family transcriptional regulator [Aquicoccus sp. G2-2]MEA1114157.1 MarR family transcriptional regulator [Aquicoccus sp. G2-2]
MTALARNKARAEVSDAVLRGFIGYHMKRAFNVLQADLHRVLKPFGLRMVTYSALALIVENPGARQGELADALAIERPNLVVLLDGLEKAGLIRRDKVPEDRRAYALMPTVKGRGVMVQATEAIRADEARLLKGLDAKTRQTVIDVMGRIEKG